MTAAVEPTIVHKPWPFRACPDCEGETFAAASRDHNVVFTCLGCQVNWRYVLGYLQRLDPIDEPMSVSPTNGWRQPLQDAV